MAILVQSGDPGRKGTPPRLQEDLRRRHQRPTTEFGAALDMLGIAHHRVARLFSVGARAIRRWKTGERSTPTAVNLVVRLLAMGIVTIAEIERAAVSIPTWTNGRPEPPAPLLPVAPVSEQPVAAGAEAAALADPGPSTAEKVVALAADVCHWPCGDPAQPDFHFCGSPASRRPYCEEHRAVAYWRR